MEFTKIENKRVNEEYYRLEHSSGLTVIVYPKKGFNSVYASIGTKFGSIYSRFTNNCREICVPDGTAHYLEHKLFESEDGDAFSKYAKTGASANAYTSFDMTCYLFSCTDKFRESLEILIDLIQTPYFTKETVAKEQGIIAQEIKMYDDSPDWRVMMNLFKGLYHHHPINIDIAGSVESIAEITPEILYECYNSYYNLHNMVMTVVGGVDPQEVRSIVDEKIRPSEKIDTQVLFPEEPYKVVRSYTEQVLPVAVPMFELGFKEDSGSRYATSRELIATSILMNAFVGESSELYRRLLDAKLVNAAFGHEYLEGLGYRSLIISGESRNPKAAAEMIDEAVRKLHKTGISEAEFENARKVVYGKMVAGFDYKSSLASELMNGEFTGRKLFDGIEAVADITLKDINERLEVQLDADNCCLSVVKGM